MAGLEHLEELAIGSVPISDEVIPSIAKIPSLRRLTVVGKNHITESGLRNLHSLRPDCHISA